MIKLIPILFFSITAFSQNLAELNKSVVKIVYSNTDIGKAKSGTGFVWKKNNQVITALHLVTGSNGGKIYVFIPADKNFTKGTFYSAKLVKILKSADLAMLQVTLPQSSVIPLMNLSSSVFLKQNVDVIGYPLGVSGKRSIQLTIPFNESKQLRANIPPGTLSELNKLKFDANLEVVNFQGSLLPGLSGAPIFNKNGQIVAIGNGGLNKGQVGISWGIPSSKINDLENSLESVTEVDNNFSKSSEIAFSSEIPININSLGEDFLLREKEILQEDMFKIQGLFFYKVSRKSYAEILKYSNDQQGLIAAGNAFPKADLTKTDFDIYRNFDTGATFVFPTDHKITVNNNGLEFQSINVNLKINLQYYRLAKSYDMTDALCQGGRINTPVDSLGFWQKNIAWSSPNPVTTFDGQYVNREAFGKYTYVHNSSNIQSLVFLFITTAKKNKDLFFLTLTDNDATPEYNQNLSMCLQNIEGPDCSEVLQKYREIAKLVICQYLFSFSD